MPGVPAGPAGGFQIKNLTPLGYSARAVPYTGTGSGGYNSDLAFNGNLVFAGPTRASASSTSPTRRTRRSS